AFEFPAEVGLIRITLFVSQTGMMGVGEMPKTVAHLFKTHQRGHVFDSMAGRLLEVTFQCPDRRVSRRRHLAHRYGTALNNRLSAGIADCIFRKNSFIVASASLILPPSTHSFKMG